MRFGNLQAFWFLLSVPLGLAFYFWAFHRKRRTMDRFGNPMLVARLTSVTSFARQGGKAAMILTGIFFLVLSLGQPQFGTKLELLHRRGVDIVIALDTSLSMLAEDIKPNRLTRARYEIEGLIDRLEGDRVGLVAFAGKGLVLCPLTLDYGAAKLFLNTVRADLISVRGTAIGEAVRVASRVFGSSEKKYKALILITDGEDHAGDPLDAAEAASEAGVRIFSVGVGTPDGELVPVRDGGEVNYLRDPQGQIVKTRLDQATLEKMAALTDGAYVRAAGGKVGLEEVYARIAEMEKKDLGSRRYTLYIERFQWPLVLALGCLLGEALISERRKRKVAWRGRFQ